MEIRRLKERYNNSVHQRLRMYKNNAKQRKIEFHLKDDEAFALFRSPCHYCGFPGNSLNGIDRKDPKGEYTTENILPCCAICNRAKFTHSYAEFGAYLDRVAKFRKAE